MASQFAPLVILVFLTFCYRASCYSITNSSPNEAFLANTTQTVIPVQKIVNGDVAKENEFPWRCYITSGSDFVCGCSLVSRTWVLTAAHCTTNFGSNRITVHLGSHDRSERNWNEQKIRVYYVINHPAYTGVLPLENDIAMIRLAWPARITSKVYPINLPFHLLNEDFSGESGVTSGWGATQGFGMASLVLRKTTMKIMSNEECSQSHGMNIPDNLICGMKWGSSACSGDSGGSIDIERNGTPYIIGITSWGDWKCEGTTPTVFTRVTSHMLWMHNYLGH